MRQSTYFRLLVRGSSLLILGVVADLVYRFNLTGTYYVCAHARHANELEMLTSGHSTIT